MREEKSVQARRELQPIEDRRAHALAVKNVAAFMERIAPDYTLVTPEGKTLSRQEVEANTRDLVDQVQEFSLVAFRIQQVVLNGNSAVATIQKEIRAKKKVRGTVADDIRQSSLEEQSWQKSSAGWRLFKSRIIRIEQMPK